MTRKTFKVSRKGEIKEFDRRVLLWRQRNKKRQAAALEAEKAAKGEPQLLKEAMSGFFTEKKR